MIYTTKLPTETGFYFVAKPDPSGFVLGIANVITLDPFASVVYFSGSQIILGVGSDSWGRNKVQSLGPVDVPEPTETFTDWQMQPFLDASQQDCVAGVVMEESDRYMILGRPECGTMRLNQKCAARIARWIRQFLACGQIEPIKEEDETKEEESKQSKSGRN